MLGRFVISIGVLIMSNIGMYVALIAIGHNEWDEYKLISKVLNAIFIIVLIFYTLGIIKTHY